MDIVERLRYHDDERLYQEADVLMSEAADEIEHLRAEVAELEQVLSEDNCPRKYVQQGGYIRCLYGTSSIAAYETLSAEVDALQAKIDALMLEYCPEEMTPEQVAAYEAAQRPVDEAQIARIDAAMKGEV